MDFVGIGLVLGAVLAFHFVIIKTNAHLWRKYHPDQESNLYDKENTDS